MYISNVSIENIRCFKSIDIPFTRENSDASDPRKWTVVLGDNSTGKTCLLRCIAIGLCDESSAAALMKELGGDFIRKEKGERTHQKEGKIEISLYDPDYGSFKITTIIFQHQGVEKIKKEFDPLKSYMLRNKIFVCGYGSQRAGENNTSFRKYSPVDAVLSLFDYSTNLQQPELNIRRRYGANRKALLKKLEKVLMLDILSKTTRSKCKIRLVPFGVVVDGPWGTMQMDEMSDGYWSTYCWIVDFISWFSYGHRTASLEGKKLKGIVLLDELELHLHPNWQKFIAARLYKAFPSIQFITTTHSPLVAAGVQDLDEIAQVVSLKFSDDHIRRIEDLPSLKGLRADQVLTSEAFGLSSAVSGNTSLKYERFRKLYLKDKLTSQEKVELKRLMKTIEDIMPESGETIKERKIQSDLIEILSELKAK